MEDPYVLDPPRSQRGPDGTDPRGVKWNQALEGWTQTGMFHAIDNRTVRRSNALLNYTYGDVPKMHNSDQVDLAGQKWAAVSAGCLPVLRACLLAR